MAYQYSNRKVLIDSTSTSTSGAYFIGDYRRYSLSWSSSASLGPSRFTVEVSNADGLQTSDLGGSTSAANWSLSTGVNIIGRSSGEERFDGGPRWLRVTVPPANHSAASVTSIVLNGQTW